MISIYVDCLCEFFWRDMAITKMCLKKVWFGVALCCCCVEVHLNAMKSNLATPWTSTTYSKICFGQSNKLVSITWIREWQICRPENNASQVFASILNTFAAFLFLYFSFFSIAMEFLVSAHVLCEQNKNYDIAMTTRRSKYCFGCIDSKVLQWMQTVMSSVIFLIKMKRASVLFGKFSIDPTKFKFSWF